MLATADRTKLSLKIPEKLVDQHEDDGRQNQEHNREHGQKHESAQPSHDVCKNEDHSHDQINIQKLSSEKILTAKLFP